MHKQLVHEIKPKLNPGEKKPKIDADEIKPNQDTGEIKPKSEAHEKLPKLEKDEIKSDKKPRIIAECVSHDGSHCYTRHTSSRPYLRYERYNRVQLHST